MPAPRSTPPPPASSARPQDELAAKSHERAAKAQKDGLFDDEIVPVEVPQRKGDPVVVDDGRGRARRAPPPSRLGGLRPAFDKAGNITAGNASQISDGGAAVIVVSKAKAEELGVTPLGEIVGYGQVAGPDPSLLTQPARAIKARGRGSGTRRRRHRPVRAERGLRRRRRGLDGRPRHHRRRSSTSTAAPSPSATRSACPAPASPCTCSSSWAAAVAASARPPSAAVAARATPSSSRSDRTIRSGA